MDVRCLGAGSVPHRGGSGSSPSSLSWLLRAAVRRPHSHRRLASCFGPLSPQPFSSGPSASGGDSGFRPCLSAVGRLVHVFDLTDAYFHVMIHPAHRKGVRFVWKERVFPVPGVTVRLPPRPSDIHARGARAGLSGRGLGVRVYTYIYVWLIKSQTKEVWHAHIQLVLQQAQLLVFSVILAESELLPSQRFSYRGMAFFTVLWVVGPVPLRVERLQPVLASRQVHQGVSARLFALLLGLGEFLVPVPPLAGVTNDLFGDGSPRSGVQTAEFPGLLYPLLS